MLSKSAQYALRIMASFALAEKNSPLRAKDLADDVSIPVFYLSKILRHLVKARLLKGNKGHGGGFTIAKPPGKIKFCHILKAVGEDLTKKKCVFGWNLCKDSDPCILHHRWKKISDYFVTWAKETSLADLKKDFSKLDFLNQNLPLKQKIKKH